MELVNGEPLSAILARAGRLSPDATLDIVSQAARALDAAHQARHRAPRHQAGQPPGRRGGTTKITDFGIATAVAAAQASHLTETGMVMGTAMYVSPEQATGAQVTEASDIYSLGVVAFECLAGHPPLHAPASRWRSRSRTSTSRCSTLPPDVPQPVSDLVYHDAGQDAAGAAGQRAGGGRPRRHAARRTGPGRGRGAGYPGATRADLPTAATGALPRAADTGPSAAGGASGTLPGATPHCQRRQLVVVSSTAALCAAAAAAGLYLTGHISGRNSGNVDTQHGAAPELVEPLTPSHQTSQPSPSTLTPTPSQSASSLGPGAESERQPEAESSPLNRQSPQELIADQPVVLGEQLIDPDGARDRIRRQRRRIIASGPPTSR